MKILLTIDSLGSGGAQHQLALLAKGLVERGHSVDIFLYHPRLNFFAQSLESHNISIRSVEKASRFDLAPISGLRQMLQSGHYDVSAAFMFTPGLYLLAARGLSGAPPAIMSHRHTFPGEGLPLSAQLALSAYAAADLVVCNSYRGAEQIATRLPFLKRKLKVIINGVELDRFRKCEVRPIGHLPSFLFVGRLSPEKNILRLLEAMALMRSCGDSVPQILWAGRVESSELSYALEVQRRVKELELSANWVPLGERTNIPELLAECDALILPSIFEGTPNALCEALAVGRPVLASRVGDVDRLVADKVSGILFDPLDVNDIAKKMRSFLQMDLTDRCAMGSAAHSSAESALSMKAYVDNWENVFRDTMRRRNCS